MKHFIITVDTEGDNQWAWKPGTPIKTDNTAFIPRFQELCEGYGFPPVYLTNYEMIMDDRFVDYIKPKAQEGKCEIGMHIHAWNSPPNFELDNRFGGCSYITEYPNEVISEKLDYLKTLITERTGVSPVSFRSGRWATNGFLFSELDRLGFLVDCSITPGISYSTDKGMTVERGNNYLKEEPYAHKVHGDLIEVPMSTRRMKTIEGLSLKNRVRNFILGKDIWLRPTLNTFEEMKALCKSVEKDKTTYLEFMIHSSELMPGGSPFCKDSESIETMYKRMTKLFEYLVPEYKGITLAEFYKTINRKL